MKSYAPLNSAMCTVWWFFCNALMSAACGSKSVIFERGVSPMPPTTPFQSFTLESKLRCALFCSRDVTCEFLLYQSHEQNCYHYRASELPNYEVAHSPDGTFSYRGMSCRNTLLICIMLNRGPIRQRCTSASSNATPFNLMLPWIYRVIMFTNMIAFIQLMAGCQSASRIKILCICCIIFSSLASRVK